MTESEHDLTINRHLAASTESVWRAWTKREYLEQWWCPRPWQATIRAFDLVPGGGFDTQVSGPGGEQHFYPGAFLEIVPQSRIVITSALGAGWRPVDNPFLPFTAIITMAPRAGGTDYSVVVRHPSADVSKRHVDMGFYDGWATVIDQLGEVAAGLPAA